jgi:hypothetical protein
MWRILMFGSVAALIGAGGGIIAAVAALARH